MKLNDLFDRISEEDVVLFVGAGVSMSAGLPSGKQLSNVIFNMLPIDIRDSLESQKDDLTETSQSYIDYNGDKSRSSLINEIQMQFDYVCRAIDINNTPISYLSKAPHFGTIISTNYDFLIEECLGDRCIVVANDADIPNVKTSNNFTILVKIHGDFNNHKRFILTKDDYNKLYHQDSMCTPIWNYVSTLLATKSVLFLGYGYNDGNIDSILSFIDRCTNNKRKPSFLISKSIAIHQKSKLRAKNIEPFEMELEEFFIKYFERFNESIIPDYNAGKTSYKVMNQYVNRYVSASVENDQVVAVKPISNDIPITLNFSSNDKDLRSRLFNRDNFDSIEIFDVQQYCFKIGDIVIPNEEIEMIRIIRSPDESFKSSVYFFKTDFGVNDICTSIYKGKSLVRVKCKLSGGTITIDVNYSRDAYNVTFNLQLDSNRSIAAELESLELLDNFVNAGEFRVTTTTGVSITRDSLFKGSSLLWVDSLKKRIAHLIKLKKVERYYNVAFDLSIEPTAADINNADVLFLNTTKEVSKRISAAGDIAVRSTFYSPESANDDSLMIKEDNRVLFITDEYCSVDLYGQHINLGYMVFEVIDPENFNVTTNTDGDKEVEFIAVQGKYKMYYDNKPPKEYVNN